MDSYTKNIIKDIFLIVFGILLFFTCIFLLVSLLTYYESCQKAKVFNRLNNTDFTCWDFFWAEDQINQQTQTIKLQK